MPTDTGSFIRKDVSVYPDPQGAVMNVGRDDRHEKYSVQSSSGDTDTHPILTSDEIRGGVGLRNPKILLLSQILPPLIGGSGRYFWEIVRRMPRDRIVVMSDLVPGAVEFDATHLVPTIRMPMAFHETGTVSRRGLSNYVAIARRVRDECVRHNIEYLWCGRCVPEGWIGWMVNQLAGIPYFVSAHGEEVTIPESGSTAGVMTSRQHRWMARRVFANAAGVIANSENTRHIIRNSWNVPDERIHRVTPGVETDVFVPAPACETTRATLGWVNRTVLLTVGRLQKRKGHDLMIAALNRVREKIPNVLYAIVGDGPERERLTELVGKLKLNNHVRFYGECDFHSLVRAYQQSDLFVLPNRQIGAEIEGFGMVLLEAQSCGKPVIAGASGGTSETMGVFKTGFVVDCTNLTTLADATTMLLSDEALRQKMGLAAREWVIRNFEWSSRVNQVDGLVSDFHDKSVP